MTGENNVAGDKALGMERAITRRDFLGSTLLASGAVLLEGLTPTELLAQKDEFTGYGGVGEYRTSNGNTWAVLQAGPSGRCLVLENHPIFGGEAKQNEFLVDGKRLVAHQGSAIYQLQQPQSFLADFYESVGLKSPKLTYQKWAGPQPEMPLSRTPYDAAGMDYGQYGFWFDAKFGYPTGLWVMDPVRRKLEGAPISASSRTEWLRWRTGGRKKIRASQGGRRRGFALSRFDHA